MGIAAAAGAAGAGALWWYRTRPEEAPPPPTEVPFTPEAAFPNPLRLPGADGMYGVLDASSALTLIAKPVQHELLPGKPARMLAYEVEHLGRTYRNPVLRVRTGAQVRINFWNALDETSIVHWHGLKVDANNDGHPHYAVPGGATYDYHFTVANRAAMHWYHPHAHHLTGKQIYLGLAGLFIVEDDEDLALQRALDLRLGETDIPLVLQDRRFDESGGLVYAPGAEDRFAGHYGAETLVNLTSRPHFLAATRVYRFRILNASNARMFRLAFRHGEEHLEFRVIGNDGGLLDRPHPAKELFLSPGERVDALLDLRAAALGDAVTLASLAFDPMHHEGEAAGGHDAHAHHGGHGGHGSGEMPYVPDGEPLDLMRIHVLSRVAYENAVPDVLSRLEPPAAAAGKPRIITIDQVKGRWRINGQTYKPSATPIVVPRGATEVWEIRNHARSMPHPMHIHGFVSRVLSREGSPEQQRGRAVTETGLAVTDLGWKDTVLSWPGETVRVVTDFSHPYVGEQVYMVHCHNLEHADGDMMVNLKIAGDPASR
jgi:suppressor of ftsI/bilirubin oxidase